MLQSEWLQKRVKADFGFTLTDRQLQQFAQYFDLLVEVNKNLNLTAITDPDEVYIKHFYDSLSLVKVVEMEKINTIIDVGTGAGFPGIPLKIAFPHLSVVLVDSLKKRIAFLESVVTELRLDQVTCLHGRAENLGQQKEYRQQFDLATARAVAKLNILAEYCIPFVKADGTFIAMKGASTQEELTQAERALARLGKAQYRLQPFSLPEEKGERNLICIHKKGDTPSTYPRRAGLPKKQPL